MARERDPNRDKAKELYRANPEISNREIAVQLGVKENTISVWKLRDKWNDSNVVLQTKKTVVLQKKTARKMLESVDDNEELNEREKLFCLFVSQNPNYTSAARRAGYAPDYANRYGSHLAQKPKIAAEIKRLRELRSIDLLCSAEDVFALHWRIAFADITDFAEFGRRKIPVLDPTGEIVMVKDEKTGEYVPLEREVNEVRFRESEHIDGSILSEVKVGRDGASVKLADRQASLRFLERWFELNPMDKHKIEYDNLRLELERKKIEPEPKEPPKYNGIPARMIAPVFGKVLFDIANKDHAEYVFPGGRGGTKSSFISLAIIDLLMKHDNIHAVVGRQVADTLRTSVYQQIVWSVSALGLDEEFHCTVSPLEVTRISTGQKIYFRGADDPGKIKSIKTPFGYIAILWLEELDQFAGEESVRKIEQSVIRGGDMAYIFKSFNPPKSANNWANKYVNMPKANRLVTWSTYLDVPKEWLGKPFIDEAEFLKEVNPVAYENEYMGVANGTGGNVFDNLAIKAITDEEIKAFDRVYFGVDWGWYPDPWAFNKMYYNAAQHKLYIFDEDRRNKTSNEETARILKEEHGITANDKVVCDSAENKSVSDYKEFGLFARGAIKGPGSVEYSMKWLQSLREIVIDNVRCPGTATEFLDYEYDRDKEGNVISGYPDKNNHNIDAVRYAMEEVWKRRGQ